MTRHFRTTLTALAATLFTASLAQANETPPDSLQGKSIKVRWAEEWVQKPVGATNQFKTYIEQTYIIYVSTQGRVFQRRTIVQDRKPMVALSVERVGSEQQSLSRVTSFGPPDFERNKVIATRPTSSASTTKATMTLDDKLENCTAAIAHDRGTEPAIYTGPSTGKKFEVVTIKVTIPPVCEVVPKNLLGDEGT